MATRLYINKRTKQKYYLSDEEVAEMKKKHLFGNFTPDPDAKELEASKPLEDVLEFHKKMKEEKKSKMDVHSKIIAGGTSIDDIPKVIVEDRPKPKKRRTKKKTND